MKNFIQSCPSFWPIYTLVGTVSVVVYLNSLEGDFVHDDIPAIIRNKDVTGENSILELFKNDFWGMSMADIRSHKSYRPLTVLTFRLNRWFFDLSPFWFHVINILLHLCATILFTRTCLELTHLEAPFSTLAGLLFAVHPIHTEAVSGIVGRADILSAILFLTSLLLYHGSVMKGHQYIALVIGSMSMFAKETGITVFLVIFFFDFYKSWIHLKTIFTDLQWTTKSQQFAKRTFLTFTMFTILITLRLGILQGSLPTFSEQDNPAAFHPSTLVRTMTFWYLMAFNWWLLLCPSTLSHDWQMGSVPLVTTIFDSRNILTCFFLVFLISLLLKSISNILYQENASEVLGVLLLILPFLPATNLVVTVGFVIAERILYIPSMGLILLVVNGIRTLWKHARHRQTVLSLLLIILLSHCLRCVIRNRDWHSRETLLRAGIATLPHNAKMHYNYANFLKDSGRTEFAILHYHAALRLWPNYASAHNNLGTLLKNRRQAEQHFLQAIRVSQSHLNAYYNLGRLYLKLNRTKDSVIMFKKCWEISSRLQPIEEQFEYESLQHYNYCNITIDELVGIGRKMDALQISCAYAYLSLKRDNL